MKNVLRILSLCMVMLLAVGVIFSFAACGKDNSDDIYSNISGSEDSWNGVKLKTGDILSVVPPVNNTVAYWETNYGKKSEAVTLYFAVDIEQFQEYADSLLNDGWEINNGNNIDTAIYKRGTNYYADFIKGNREIHISYSDGGGLTSLDWSYSMSVEVIYNY